MIYHITTPIEWKLAKDRGSYFAPSLDNEGFIHCSTAQQVVMVANAFYQQESEIILLCIDDDKLEPEVKWEAPAHPEGHEPPPEAEVQQFPHIYGEINLDAVLDVVRVPSNEDGYYLPEGIN